MESALARSTLSLQQFSIWKQVFDNISFLFLFSVAIAGVPAGQLPFTLPAPLVLLSFPSAYNHHNPSPSP